MQYKIEFEYRIRVQSQTSKGENILDLVYHFEHVCIAKAAFGPSHLVAGCGVDDSLKYRDKSAFEEKEADNILKACLSFPGGNEDFFLR